MFSKNEIWAGLLIGILLPVAGFLLLTQLFQLLELKGAASGTGLSENFRERTLAIVSIALNLLLLNIYRRRRWDAAIRGVVVATAVLALLWLVKFGLQLV